MRAITLAIILFTSLASAQRPPVRKPRPHPVMLQQKLNIVLAELGAIETLMQQMRGDNSTRRLIQTKLAALKITLTTLLQQVPSQIQPIVVVHADISKKKAEQPPRTTSKSTGPQAMESHIFASLLESIRAQAFKDGKIKVIQSAAINNYFNVVQLIGVLKLITFSDDKLKVVQLVNPRIVDRKNLFQLYGSFRFDADKNALKRILKLQK